MYRITFLLDLGNGILDKHSVKLKASSPEAACAELREKNGQTVKNIISVRKA